MFPLLGSIYAATITMIMNTHNNNNNNNQSDCSDKSNQRYHDYVQALEQERRKVQVFQRELPLCLELVTQAIETWKQRLTGATTTTTEQNDLSECSEETSTPILEEFIPIHKPNSSHSVDEEEPTTNKEDATIDCDRNPMKSDWLRSVQLWNQTPDPHPKQDSPRKSSVLEVKSNGSCGAFHPFKKGKSVGDYAAAVPPPSTSSTADTTGVGGSKKEEKEGQSQRKTRRCWSPELHKRFLRALQQLGGSHVATPKQIRELMKVDGLTNDEVKSHLQKYRLHTRRPSSSSHNNNNNAQTQQFVVVGGIWVPPEYHAGAATTTSDAAGGRASFNEIYAPIATLPPPLRETSPSPKQRHNKSSSSRDSGDTEGGDQSYSPASSSSTHKTTVSLPC